ncbi:phosphonate C-P lyase system protein PhnL [Halotalea alkalilenta]|uniref:Phosphonate C-P lyase system protein PhnL n=2 Tax=Halotalea alkalilenta TaxID=376489 RepID=A0A172YDS0_9GAMM|nr:phosphonate C-P lyase system protein PhnL [Halotalea alkalilenta]
MFATPSIDAEPPLLEVEALSKRFVLHARDGLALEVMRELSFSLRRAECLVLDGPSGIGKSTLLKLIHGDYLASGGRIRLNFADGPLELTELPASAWHRLRARTIGYVSQFLRVVPRVPAEEVVIEPLLARGVDERTARDRAREMLARLNLPERLWRLPPGTFSGGEQQRVNLARAFVVDYPILLLDEPTASLDGANREVVIELIDRARRRGAGMIGIFHDPDVRERVADRRLALEGHLLGAREGIRR